MSEEKLLERGYRKYHGEEIDVYFNTPFARIQAIV